MPVILPPLSNFGRQPPLSELTVRFPGAALVGTVVVLVLGYRNDPHRLALIFAAEAASYVLMLFEDREGLLFVYRSALTGLLLLAVLGGTWPSRLFVDGTPPA